MSALHVKRGHQASYVETKVFARIRPLSRERIQQGATTAYTLSNPKCLVLKSSAISICTSAEGQISTEHVSPKDTYDKGENEARFTFNGGVFGEFTDTATIYASAIQPVVLHLSEGVDSVVLVHGPQGTGKSYTLFGTLDHPGVIFHAFQALFNHIASYKSMKIAALAALAHKAVLLPRGSESGWTDWNYEFCVRCSFFEVRSHHIIDLLRCCCNSGYNVTDTLPTLGVHRMTSCGQLPIEGLFEHDVSSVKDIVHFLARAASLNKARDMLRRDTPSSSVVVITVEKATTFPEAGDMRKEKQYQPDLQHDKITEITVSKLIFVELAELDIYTLVSPIDSEKNVWTSSAGKTLSEDSLLPLPLLSRVLEPVVNGYSNLCIIATLDLACANLPVSLPILRRVSALGGLKRRISRNTVLPKLSHLCSLHRDLARAYKNLQALEQELRSSTKKTTSARHFPLDSSNVSWWAPSTNEFRSHIKDLHQKMQDTRLKLLQGSTASWLELENARLSLLTDIAASLKHNNFIREILRADGRLTLANCHLASEDKSAEQILSFKEACTLQRELGVVISSNCEEYHRMGSLGKTKYVQCKENLPRCIPGAQTGEGVLRSPQLIDAKLLHGKTSLSGESALADASSCTSRCRPAPSTEEIPLWRQQQLSEHEVERENVLQTKIVNVTLQQKIMPDAFIPLQIHTSSKVADRTQLRHLACKTPSYKALCVSNPCESFMKVNGCNTMGSTTDLLAQRGPLFTAAPHRTFQATSCTKSSERTKMTNKQIHSVYGAPECHKGNFIADDFMLEEPERDSEMLNDISRRFTVAHQHRSAPFDTIETSVDEEDHHMHFLNPYLTTAADQLLNEFLQVPTDQRSITTDISSKKNTPRDILAGYKEIKDSTIKSSQLSTVPHHFRPSSTDAILDSAAQLQSEIEALLGTEPKPNSQIDRQQDSPVAPRSGGRTDFSPSQTDSEPQQRSPSRVGKHALQKNACDRNPHPCMEKGYCVHSMLPDGGARVVKTTAAGAAAAVKSCQPFQVVFQILPSSTCNHVQQTVWHEKNGEKADAGNQVERDGRRNDDSSSIQQAGGDLARAFRERSVGVEEGRQFPADETIRSHCRTRGGESWEVQLDVPASRSRGYCLPEQSAKDLPAAAQSKQQLYFRKTLRPWLADSTPAIHLRNRCSVRRQQFLRKRNDVRRGYVASGDRSPMQGRSCSDSSKGFENAATGDCVEESGRSRDGCFYLQAEAGSEKWGEKGEEPAEEGAGERGGAGGEKIEDCGMSQQLGRSGSESPDSRSKSGGSVRKRSECDLSEVLEGSASLCSSFCRSDSRSGPINANAEDTSAWSSCQCTDNPTVSISQCDEKSSIASPREETTRQSLFQNCGLAAASASPKVEEAKSFSSGSLHSGESAAYEPHSPEFFEEPHSKSEKSITLRPDTSFSDSRRVAKCQQRRAPGSRLNASEKRSNAHTPSESQLQSTSQLNYFPSSREFTRMPTLRPPKLSGTSIESGSRSENDEATEQCYSDFQTKAGGTVHSYTSSNCQAKTACEHGARGGVGAIETCERIDFASAVPIPHQSNISTGFSFTDKTAQQQKVENQFTVHSVDSAQQIVKDMSDSSHLHGAENVHGSISIQPSSECRQTSYLPSVRNVTFQSQSSHTVAHDLFTNTGTPTFGSISSSSGSIYAAGAGTTAAATALPNEGSELSADRGRDGEEGYKIICTIRRDASGIPLDLPDESPLPERSRVIYPLTHVSRYSVPGDASLDTSVYNPISRYSKDTRRWLSRSAPSARGIHGLSSGSPFFLCTAQMPSPHAQIEIADKGLQQPAQVADMRSHSAPTCNQQELIWAQRATSEKSAADTGLSQYPHASCRRPLACENGTDANLSKRAHPTYEQSQKLTFCSSPPTTTFHKSVQNPVLPAPSTQTLQNNATTSEIQRKAKQEAAEPPSLSRKQLSPCAKDNDSQGTLLAISAPNLQEGKAEVRHEKGSIKGFFDFVGQKFKQFWEDQPTGKSSEEQKTSMRLAEARCFKKDAWPNWYHVLPPTNSVTFRKTKSVSPKRSNSSALSKKVQPEKWRCGEAGVGAAVFRTTKIAEQKQEKDTPPVTSSQQPHHFNGDGRVTSAQPITVLGSSTQHVFSPQIHSIPVPSISVRTGTPSVFHAPAAFIHGPAGSTIMTSDGQVATMPFYGSSIHQQESSPVAVTPLYNNHINGKWSFAPANAASGGSCPLSAPVTVSHADQGLSLNTPSILLHSADPALPSENTAHHSPLYAIAAVDKSGRAGNVVGQERPVASSFSSSSLPLVNLLSCGDLAAGSDSVIHTIPGPATANSLLASAQQAMNRCGTFTPGCAFVAPTKDGLQIGDARQTQNLFNTAQYHGMLSADINSSTLHDFHKINEFSCNPAVAAEVPATSNKYEANQQRNLCYALDSHMPHGATRDVQHPVLEIGILKSNAQR